MFLVHTYHHLLAFFKANAYDSYGPFFNDFPGGFFNDYLHLSEDKDREVMQAIKEATNCVPQFEIHGFGVYLYDPENKIAGINKCCKLPPKDNSGKIRITNPISPIYWKLICLLDLQDQADTMAHNLVHILRSLTAESWKIAKLELSDIYKLKYLLTQNEDDRKLSKDIRESEYDNKVWKFNDEKVNYKEFIERLGLTRIKSASIHWVLVSDKVELETALKNELDKLSTYPLICNHFEFNQETQFHRWDIKEIETKEKLEKKLKTLPTEDNQADKRSYVFLFDTMIPVYQYETKKGKRKIRQQYK